MQYRADIDGLRAVAILPVIFFHLDIKPFSGGFVGVDIFFVISGFLITTIIYNKMCQGTFSLVYFYDRRARRILPALFFMLAATTAASWFILLPQEYSNYSKSLVSTTIFGSNFYFWLSADYFDAAAESKPLLHTWSLAVEEQFYIFFPIFLAFVTSRYKGYLHSILWAAFILSLVGSVFGVFYKPVLTFYLTPARAWELTCGALLAVGSISPPNSRNMREVMGILGVALIALSVILLDESSTFPGLNAIAPCAGAMLIIMAGMGQSQSRVNMALASRMPVFIGQLSYSLYLWHWPLIVFTRMLYPGQLDAAMNLMLLAVSAVLAYISLRFVEQPFRKRRVCSGSTGIFCL